MPIITPFPDPTRAYVRVEVNWSDTPAVEFARVLRVDSVTGECTPLRPYVCFDGDYLKLSCGHGVFWDTEVPLDRQVYYITEGLSAPCLPAPAVVLDTFTRVNVDTWNNATTGQAWVNTGGAAADYDVNGAQGTHTHPAVNVLHHSLIETGATIQDIRATVPITALATGAAIAHWVVGGVIDTNNHYIARLDAGTAGTMTFRLNKRVGGVLTSLATLVDGVYAAGDVWNIRFQVWGSLLRAKFWPITAVEPANWSLTAIDTDLSGGTQAGLLSRLEAGNTNTLPYIFAFDNFSVEVPCTPCVPVTAQTSPLTVGSDGMFRLKDPVRPCRDLAVPLCFDQVASPECLPGSGIFFASMGTEAFAANSISVNPTNARRPLAVTRTRRDVASVLTLVTRTFTDRDALNLITEPGSPLLLQGPPQYGIPDRYMDVGDVSEDRGLSNHKRQARVLTLPHVAVDRPAGPTQGVCGSQVGDLCDIYASWDAMETAGLTWEDLIRGRAGQPNPIAGYRTWDDVQAEFADWNAVDNGTRTWTDLEVGS